MKFLAWPNLQCLITRLPDVEEGFENLNEAIK